MDFEKWSQITSPWHFGSSMILHLFRHHPLQESSTIEIVHLRMILRSAGHIRITSRSSNSQKAFRRAIVNSISIWMTKLFSALLSSPGSKPHSNTIYTGSAIEKNCSMCETHITFVLIPNTVWLYLFVWELMRFQQPAADWWACASTRCRISSSVVWSVKVISTGFKHAVGWPTHPLTSRSISGTTCVIIIRYCPFM